MLRSLSQGDLTIGELAAPLRMSRRRLQACAGPGARGTDPAVDPRPQPRLQPESEPMAEAMQWLRFYERFWSDKLDALETVLLANPRPTPQTGESHE